MLKSRKSIHLSIFFLFLFILIIGLILWGWISPNKFTDDCSFPNNGAWLSVDWTSSPINHDDVQQLAELSSKRQIRYLYPYVSYLRRDGTFSNSYAYAAEFTETFRQYNKDSYLLAWVGIPIQNEGSFGVKGSVDLSDAATREKIVSFVTTVVEEGKFDGVHLNVETVYDSNPYYLLLLKGIREEIGEGKIFSIAGSYWLPDTVNNFALVEQSKWGDDYFLEVAKHVDQIAVMTYDSLAIHPVLYRLWMREQVQSLQTLFQKSDTELLIGISVSEEETPTHWPSAENLQNGLAGFCAAQKELTLKNSSLSGVAIYAAWEASDSDWEIWDSWLHLENVP